MASLLITALVAIFSLNDVTAWTYTYTQYFSQYSSVEIGIGTRWKEVFPTGPVSIIDYATTTTTGDMVHYSGSLILNVTVTQAYPPSGLRMPYRIRLVPHAHA